MGLLSFCLLSISKVCPPLILSFCCLAKVEVNEVILYVPVILFLCTVVMLYLV